MRIPKWVLVLAILVGYGIILYQDRVIQKQRAVIQKLFEQCLER